MPPTLCDRARFGPGFLRSPYPHARVVKIDVSRAQRLGGVKTVLTGKEVSPRLEGVSLLDKPVLAQDRVRYIGEKVAAVAAVDRDTVEQALDLIDVEYEPLPAVFDPMEAMSADAPLLHPEFASYEGENKTRDLGNVRSFVHSAKGDLERGFLESDEIFENTFCTQMVHQGFIEPRATLVEIDARGRVGIWQCHQSPFGIRKWLADHADIPEEMIVVHPVSRAAPSAANREPRTSSSPIIWRARRSGRLSSSRAIRKNCKTASRGTLGDRAAHRV